MLEVEDDDLLGVLAEEVVDVAEALAHGVADQRVEDANVAQGGRVDVVNLVWTSYEGSIQVNIP